MTVNIPEEKQVETPKKKNSAEETIENGKTIPITAENIVSWLKKNFNSENNYFNKFRITFLVLSLSLLLSINQFLIHTRFLFYNSDFFFQLIVPALLSAFIIYWVEDLNDFVLISFGGFILFVLFYLFIINFPWILGLIVDGAVITIFFNIAMFIRILPLIFVMTIFGGGIAMIIRAVIFY